LLKVENIIDELSHSQRVFLADLLGLITHLQMVLAVEQGGECVDPQGLFVRIAVRTRDISNLERSVVDAGDEAYDIQDLQHEGEVGVKSPVTATPHHLLDDRLRLLVHDWVAEANQGGDPQLLGGSEGGGEVLMGDLPEDVDEVVGMPVDDLLVIDLLDGEGRGCPRPRFLLSLDSLHSCGLLNEPYNYNMPQVFYFH
jgi:CBS domain-containing protein